MICPKDFQPCVDDMCYGGGCMRMNGEPMLTRCDSCGCICDDNLNGVCDLCELDDEQDYIED